MRCYCNDIRRINQDIQTLNSLASKTNSLSQTDSTQVSALITLSSNAASSATPENIPFLAERTRKLNEKITANQTALPRRIANEISSLQSKLYSLQASDRAYHDSLAARKR